MTTTTNRPRPVEMLATGMLDPHLPEGDPRTAWERRKAEYKLVSPANRKKYTVIVIGTGLAGSGVAAALGELGYKVESFTFHDAPRRAHSVAAQGGINAARARKVDGDSLTRFVTDTVKGGDFRGREADVWRLAEESVRVIDHMNAIGAPFAREYGGQLATRSFGGVQVSRTYYTRGQTGQQLQIAGAQALLRQVERGTVKLHTRHEMLDLVVADGRAQGVVVRDLVTGRVSVTTGHAVVLATGGYGSVFFHSTLAMNSNATATWRAHRRGAFFASPSFIQFHPTALPVSSHWQSKTTLMSESLRNDGRIWVPKRAEDCDKDPRTIAEEDRDYYLERIYPAFGNLVPRDIASRQAKNMCDEGRGVGPAIREKAPDGTERMMRRGVYLDFSEAIGRLGKDAVSARYGNLFEMYQRITGDDPYEVPMRIYPAVHYTMGGVWVDYDLQSTISGLYVTGEANFSDHGANRLGASALMQGLADGYFVLPNTINDYLADGPFEKISDNHPAVVEAVQTATARFYKLLSIQGTRSVDSFHKELGQIMWEYCGMNRTEEGLIKAIGLIRELREEYWRNVRVTGINEDFNQALERAGRVADFFELGELMCIDALHRRESCGGHFRAESQTEEGEALRHDDEFLYVAAWEWTGEGNKPILHREPLVYKAIELKQRSYK